MTEDDKHRVNEVKWRRGELWFKMVYTNFTNGHELVFFFVIFAFFCGGIAGAFRVHLSENSRKNRRNCLVP
jgi:hypothetical protein